MILSDRDLKARLAAGDLIVHPLADPELQIQPASVDLRLAAEFIVYKPAQVACLDPREPNTLNAATERATIADGEAFILHDVDEIRENAFGEFVDQAVGPDVAGRVGGKAIGELQDLKLLGSAARV